MSDFETILKRKYLQALKGLPVVIKNAAVNYSLDAFKSQSWEGTKWPGRKKNGKRPGRSLLVDTGRLKRSIGAFSRVESEKRIIWGTDVPYARVHNDGGTITQAQRSETFTRNRGRGKRKNRFAKGTKKGRGFTFKERNISMPRRQFIGNTPAFRAHITQIAKTFILKQLK
jgi:phage gpG-like protein